MRTAFVVFIVLAIISIVFIYIFYFSTVKRQERFVEIIKQKKTWAKISIIAVSPFVLYAIITTTLILIRGNCFLAYHVYVGEHHFVYYEESYYAQVEEGEQEDELREHVQGKWIEKGYVLSTPLQFPYFEYWVPDLFLEDLATSEDNKYIFTNTLGGGKFYQRVEE